MHPNIKKKINTNSPIKICAEDLNILFSKDIPMAKKHIKRCSTSLIIREMQIKTAMKCHLTPVRMAIIKIYKQQMMEGVWEKGTLLYCWWKCKWVQYGDS